MMGDPFRKMDANSSTYSPKSSPHGGRSPVVSRQDSSGTLKTTISLGKTPTILHTGPFYLMKEPPGKAELTGDKDLMTEYGLHHTLTKFKDKKVKESLASFLPNIPSINDGLAKIENATLRSVIEKPPIIGKEIVQLTPVQMTGFRLHPGPLPEKYRAMNVPPTRKHKKHKKHKEKDGTVVAEATATDAVGSETYEKKHKKQKRHEDEKERKKRKKEKKRKKKSHSPEPTTSTNSGVIGGIAGIGVSSGNIAFGSNITPSSSLSNTLSSLTATLAGSLTTAAASSTPANPTASLLNNTNNNNNSSNTTPTVSSGFDNIMNNAGNLAASNANCGSMNVSGSGVFIGSAFSGSNTLNKGSSSNVVSSVANSGNTSLGNTPGNGLLLPQQTSLY